MYTNKDHCFVICAYKENPYLEDCVLSLKAQSVKSDIIIETSTPNDHISSIAKKYDLPIIVNSGENGCAQDWNYGYNHAPYKLITIAHQDDIYDRDYVSEVLKNANKSSHPIIVYTNYAELRNGKRIFSNILLNIKSAMNAALTVRIFQKNRFIRKGILSFGNSICCPSVTLVKEHIGNDPFDLEYKNSCDYKTWLILADKNGDFVYIPKRLMCHRIYSESHTSIYITDNTRQKEDLAIMCSLWPKPIAQAIYKFYKLGQNSNSTDQS